MISSARSGQAGCMPFFLLHHRHAAVRVRRRFRRVDRLREPAAASAGSLDLPRGRPRGLVARAGRGRGGRARAAAAVRRSPHCADRDPRRRDPLRGLTPPELAGSRAGSSSGGIRFPGARPAGRSSIHARSPCSAPRTTRRSGASGSPPARSRCRPPRRLARQPERRRDPRAAGVSLARRVARPARARRDRGAGGGVRGGRRRRAGRRSARRSSRSPPASARSTRAARSSSAASSRRCAGPER